MNRDIILVVVGSQTDALAECNRRRIYNRFLFAKEGEIYIECDMRDYEMIVQWWSRSAQIRRTTSYRELDAE